MKKNILEASQTDWARIDAMPDEDIDFSDIPPVTKEMFSRAIRIKNGKPFPTANQENMPIDCDIIEFFKSQACHSYPLLINKALRDYMEAHQAK